MKQWLKKNDTSKNKAKEVAPFKYAIKNINTS